MCTDAPGLSGIDVDPASGTLVGVTDRGPNAACAPEEGAPRGGVAFAMPGFAPAMAQLALEGGGVVRVANWTGLFERLRREDGTFGARQYASGLPTKALDERPFRGKRGGVCGPWSAAPYHPGGVDLEDVRILRPGVYIGGDDYGPSLLIWRADGEILARLIPEHLGGTYAHPQGSAAALHPVLPAIFAARRGNRGFEAVAVDAAAQTVAACLESAMDGSGVGGVDAALRGSRAVRCVVLDLSDLARPTLKAVKVAMQSDARDYAPAERGLPDGVPAPTQADVRFSSAVLTDATSLVVIERGGGAVHGVQTRLVRYNLATGSDLASPALAAHGCNDVALGASGAPRGLEVVEGGAAVETVRPMDRTVVLDFAALPRADVAGMETKLEGLAVAACDAVLVSEDNDFGYRGKTYAKVYRIALDVPLTPCSEGGEL
eukprot:TRINITY_DN14921_c0_g1_i2.p1 TRINITY_DN14921_c0_g1~~TRINITY_DN14921_c0_g1_i2.p1  ORF type:complete len:433 (+),score=107.11 TRINITY_DN14921_c0_g1_i2:134-1432(+)